MEEKEKVAEDCVFERDAFMKRVMDDRELALEIVESFLDDVPGRLENLAKLISAREEQGVAREAHAVKGAAATVGGEALRKVAEEIERAAREGRLSETAAQVPRMEACFARLRDALHDFSGKGTTR